LESYYKDSLLTVYIAQAELLEEWIQSVPVKPRLFGGKTYVPSHVVEDGHKWPLTDKNSAWTALFGKLNEHLQFSQNVQSLEAWEQHVKAFEKHYDLSDQLLRSMKVHDIVLFYTSKIKQKVIHGTGPSPLHGAPPQCPSTVPLHGAPPRCPSTVPLHGAPPRW
jgi:hypothetical protein